LQTFTVKSVAMSCSISGSINPYGVLFLEDFEYADIIYNLTLVPSRSKVDIEH